MYLSIHMPTNIFEQYYKLDGSSEINPTSFQRVLCEMCGMNVDVECCPRVCVCVCVCRERERETEREKQREREREYDASCF